MYAVDPSFSTRLATVDANEVTVPVRWESLEKEPAGEYFKFDDLDASGKRYDPVQLDHPDLLSTEVLARAITGQCLLVNAGEYPG